MTKMSEKEAMKAAEQLLAKFAKIDRECFEREQHVVTTFEIEPSKKH